MSDWIPVEERLPEDELEVLLACGQNVGTGCLETGCFYRMNSAISIGVTHWLPLPDPPAIPDKKDEALRAAQTYFSHWRGHLPCSIANGPQPGPVLIKLNAALEE